MSMKYRDANGVETPVAGLNGTSGELVPSVSHYQSGYWNFSNLTNGFEDVTTLDIENQSVQYRVVFSTPMLDTDYVVVVDVHNTNLQVEVASADKTVNGFIVTVRNLVATMRADRGETTDGFTFGLSDNYFNWTAFKLMTDENRALDEQAIADIQAVIPANATSSNKLATANDLATKQDTLVYSNIAGIAGSGVRIDYQANHKYGRIVQLGMSVTLTSDIGVGGTLITGLPPSCSWLAEVWLNRNGVLHGARINEQGNITIEETIEAGSGLISGTYISAQ